jgi:hypothetical protein
MVGNYSCHILQFQNPRGIYMEKLNKTIALKGTHDKEEKDSKMQ